jgi:ssDNA-binding replication factor A large subunit
MTGKLRIDDGTGVVDVILLDQNPRQFTPVDTEEFRQRMIKQGVAILELERETLSNIIGKEIEVYGTAEAENDQKKLIFKAERIVSLGNV